MPLVVPTASELAARQTAAQEMSAEPTRAGPAEAGSGFGISDRGSGFGISDRAPGPAPGAPVASLLKTGSSGSSGGQAAGSGGTARVPMDTDKSALPAAMKKKTATFDSSCACSFGEPIDLSLLGGAEHLLTPSSDLDPAAELEGKKEALELLAHYGVFEDIPRDQSGELKKIRARWEPQDKGFAV